MRRSYVPTLIAILSLSAGLAAMTQASAQTVEQFYKGKTITVLVGNVARRHQRHHGAVRGQAFQPLHPGQSDDSTSSSRPAAAGW